MIAPRSVNAMVVNPRIFRIKYIPIRKQKKATPRDNTRDEVDEVYVN
jgi:hypothetical protein